MVNVEGEDVIAIRIRFIYEKMGKPSQGIEKRIRQWMLENNTGKTSVQQRFLDMTAGGPRTKSCILLPISVVPKTILDKLEGDLDQGSDGEDSGALVEELKRALTIKAKENALLKAELRKVLKREHYKVKALKKELELAELRMAQPCRFCGKGAVPEESSLMSPVEASTKIDDEINQDVRACIGEDVVASVERDVGACIGEVAEMEHQSTKDVGACIGEDVEACIGEVAEREHQSTKDVRACIGEDVVASVERDVGACIGEVAEREHQSTKDVGACIGEVAEREHQSTKVDEIILKTKALSCDNEQGGRELANPQK
ncbi:hypothetical protein ACROYT_G004874 [Oculina patagonica]